MMVVICLKKSELLSDAIGFAIGAKSDIDSLFSVGGTSALMPDMSSYWRNKIAMTTLYLALGTNLSGIEVFEVKLIEQLLDEGMLHQMDKRISYHT